MIVNDTMIYRMAKPKMNRNGVECHISQDLSSSILIIRLPLNIYSLSKFYSISSIL